MGLAAALLLTLLPLGRAAHADELPRVILLEPGTASRFSHEIFERLRGELQAANVTLEALPVPDETSGMEAVRTAGAGRDPDLVLLVQERGEGMHRSEEIWLSDRLAQRMFVQRIDAPVADRARSARWIAIQAVELVRGRIAESQISVPAPMPEAAPLVPPATPPMMHREPEIQPAPRLEAGAGIAVLHGFHGLADTWVPMLRISSNLFGDALARIPLTVHARVGGGFGVERGVVAGSRSADTQQSFATLDLLVRFAPRSVVQPLLSLGGGVYTLHVSGTSDAPDRNHSAQTWSGQNTVGAGFWVAPFPGAAIVAEAALMDVWSTTVVKFGREDVVHVGAPMGLLALSASAVF